MLLNRTIYIFDFDIILQYGDIFIVDLTKLIVNQIDNINQITIAANWQTAPRWASFVVGKLSPVHCRPILFFVISHSQPGGRPDLDVPGIYTRCFKYI